VPVGSLKPNSWNFNIVPDETMVSIVAGIHRHGFVGAILVWKGKSIIIDGEHRWRAARNAGLKRIPVIELELDDAKARELTVAFNQNRGYPDEDKLAEAVRFVAEATNAARKELQTMLGISAKEIDEMLHDAQAEAEDEVAKKIKKEAKEGSKKKEPTGPSKPLPPPPDDVDVLPDDDSAPNYDTGAPAEKNPTGKFPFTFYAPTIKDYERMREIFYEDGKFSFTKLNEMVEAAIEASQTAAK